MDRTSGLWGRPRRDTATPQPLVLLPFLGGAWLFFWLLYRACGRVGGHSNLFFYKFQGVFCNQAAGHDMTLMTLNTFHLMINATEYGTLPPKSSRTLCCFCKFTANSMAKFTANSMSTTRLALETCRNNALKTVTIIHNDNGRTLKESKCPVKP